jgi:murein DD-endopeptidase MepM/ murein hydrolase activator NlpD
MMKSYKIQKGDTLTGLSKKFGISIDQLARLNNIADPDKIYIGDEIRYPEINTVLRKKVPELKQQMQQMPNMRDIDPPAQSVAPEAMLMGMGVPKAMMGGLTALAGAAPAAMKAGRMIPPKGWGNVVPLGNNAAMNTGIAQAMKAANVPASSAAGARRIPAWLRDGRTEAMMRQNPSRAMGQMGEEAIKRDPMHFIGKGASEADELEDLIAYLRTGGM